MLFFSRDNRSFYFTDISHIKINCTVHSLNIIVFIRFYQRRQRLEYINPMEEWDYYHLRIKLFFSLNSVFIELDLSDLRISGIFFLYLFLFNYFFERRKKIKQELLRTKWKSLRVVCWRINRFNLNLWIFQNQFPGYQNNISKFWHHLIFFFY